MVLPWLFLGRSASRQLSKEDSRVRYNVSAEWKSSGKSFTSLHEEFSLSSSFVLLSHSSIQFSLLSLTVSPLAPCWPVVSTSLRLTFSRTTFLFFFFSLSFIPSIPRGNKDERRVSARGESLCEGRMIFEIPRRLRDRMFSPFYFFTAIPPRTAAHFLIFLRGSFHPMEFRFSPRRCLAARALSR